MSLDDELRAAVHRELMARGDGAHATIALDDVQPALARVAYRRWATRVASVALLVGTAGAASQFVRTSNNAVQMDTPLSELDLETPTHVDENNGSPVEADSSGHIDDDRSDDHSGQPPASADATGGPHIAVDTGDVTPPPTLLDPSESSGDPEPGDDGDDSSADVSTADDSNADDATNSTGDDTTADDSNADDGDSAADDGAAEWPTPIAPNSPTTSNVPTTPVPAPNTPTATQQVKTFSVACGTVTADVAPTTPIILDVTVTAGYSYHLEDPERGRVTVQFQGGGEDCELKITSSNWSGSDA
jgi:hypothetical protein